MHLKKLLMLVINALGGAAVLGSYVWGIRAHPLTSSALWGGLSPGARPYYNVSMLTAAAGYFAFLHFILLRLNPEDVRIGRRFGYGLFNVLFAAILVPSALWMPLTFAALEASSVALAGLTRVVLVIVGLASLGLLAALLHVQPRLPSWAYWLALIGCGAFCLQTAVLDMIIWSAFFVV